MSSGTGFSREGYLKENYRLFHLRDTAGQERDFHFHDFDKIVLLRSGHVDYIVENVTYSLRPGSVLLVRHHSIHRAIIDVSEPYDRIILYLDHGYFEKLMPEARLTECFDRADSTENCLLQPEGEDLSELDATLFSYEAMAGDTRYGADTIRDTLIIRLLTLLNRVSRGGEELRGTENTVSDEKIRRVLAYIDRHLTEDLSVEILADSVYLSRYHFMRLFKSQTGSTVHDYVRQRRLLHAARLIREGVPAGTAARDSGFSDYSTFSRAFTACFGIRPSDLKT